MTATASRKRYAIVWSAVLLGLLAIGLASGTFRGLLGEAAGAVTPLAVLATFPAQIVAILLCAAALWVLRPGVGFTGCLVSRMLRDAADNLLALFPGFGEAVGARAMVLAGGSARAAIAASALDRFTETLAQLPYLAFAAYVLIDAWQLSLPDLSGARFMLPALAMIALLAVAAISAWRAQSGPAERLRKWLHAEFVLLAEEFRRQKAGVPASTLLHFVAWVSGGFQIWMAASTLGFEVTLYEAIALESAAYGSRLLLFFVPAGLGAQEAGLVAAGLVFGITPAQALTIGLIYRLRDLVLGLPLLAWPLYELRHARRAGRA